MLHLVGGGGGGGGAELAAGGGALGRAELIEISRLSSAIVIPLVLEAGLPVMQSGISPSAAIAAAQLR